MRLQSRINNPTKIDRRSIKSDLKAGKLIVVQFSDKLYSDKILAELNELCLKFDENFSIRFYGHYQTSFNCETLLQLTNVKSLGLDCLLRVDNLSRLEELQNLKRLRLGIFELKETEILHAKNLQNLEELILGETRTKALNLKYLEAFHNLNYLVISGHCKNIEAVSKLRNLQYLGLNSISKVPLDFVNELEKLKALRISFGGRENLNEIKENKIETLQIIRVRAFSSFENISNFKNLKELLIEDQIQLCKINFQIELPTLTKLKLINCKKLKWLTGLEKLSGLDQLIVYKTDIIFEEFIKQTFPKSLDTFGFYTTKVKIDKNIKEKLLRFGYKCR